MATEEQEALRRQTAATRWLNELSGLVGLAAPLSTRAKGRQYQDEDKGMTWRLEGDMGAAATAPDGSQRAELIALRRKIPNWVTAHWDEDTANQQRVRVDADGALGGARALPKDKEVAGYVMDPRTGGLVLFEPVGFNKLVSPEHAARAQAVLDDPALKRIAAEHRAKLEERGWARPAPSADDHKPTDPLRPYKDLVKLELENERVRRQLPESRSLIARYARERSALMDSEEGTPEEQQQRLAAHERQHQATLEAAHKVVAQAQTLPQELADAQEALRKQYPEDHDERLEAAKLSRELLAIEARARKVLGPRGVTRHLVATHHTTPLAGADVAGAGELTLDSRKRITEVNNVSGHYKPTFTHLLQTVEELLKRGALQDQSMVQLDDEGKPVPLSGTVLKLHELVRDRRDAVRQAGERLRQASQSLDDMAANPGAPAYAGESLGAVRARFEAIQTQAQACIQAFEAAEAALHDLGVQRANRMLKAGADGYQAKVGYIGAPSGEDGLAFRESAKTVQTVGDFLTSGGDARVYDPKKEAYTETRTADARRAMQDALKAHPRARHAAAEQEADERHERVMATLAKVKPSVHARLLAKGVRLTEAQITELAARLEAASDPRAAAPLADAAAGAPVPEEDARVEPRVVYGAALDAAGGARVHADDEDESEEDEFEEDDSEDEPEEEEPAEAPAMVADAEAEEGWAARDRAEKGKAEEDESEDDESEDEEPEEAEDEEPAAAPVAQAGPARAEVPPSAQPRRSPRSALAAGRGGYSTLDE